MGPVVEAAVGELRQLFLQRGLQRGQLERLVQHRHAARLLRGGQERQVAGDEQRGHARPAAERRAQDPNSKNQLVRRASPLETTDGLS